MVPTGSSTKKARPVGAKWARPTNSVRQLLKKMFSRCSLGARSQRGIPHGRTFGLVLTTFECNDRAIDPVSSASIHLAQPSAARPLGGHATEPRPRRPPDSSHTYSRRPVLFPAQ